MNRITGKQPAHPRLYYSRSCPHCVELISLIQTDKSLSDLIEPVFVTKGVALPRELTSVPTIEFNGQFMAGSNAFKWVQMMISINLNQQRSAAPGNPGNPGNPGQQPGNPGQLMDDGISPYCMPGDSSCLATTDLSDNPTTQRNNNFEYIENTNGDVNLSAGNPAVSSGGKVSNSQLDAFTRAYNDSINKS